MLDETNPILFSVELGFYPYIVTKAFIVRIKIVKISFLSESLFSKINCHDSTKKKTLF